MEKSEQEILKDQIAEAKFAELPIEEIDGKQVFVATDETVDREGEVISIDGWDLNNFKKNPILLWSHNPFEPMIGRATNIRMRTVDGKKKLTFEPEFHGKTDLSRVVSDLVSEGWMKTVSVGFRPYERQGNKFTKQEMLEISFVNIPANPQATHLALSKGYAMDEIKKVFDGEIQEPVVPEPELEEEEKGMMENMDMMDEMAGQMDDPAMKKMMKMTAKTMRNHEGRIQKMEGMKSLLEEEINNLQVALEAKAVSEPPKAVDKGRSDAGKKAFQGKRLIQVANKALDEFLRLSKEK